MRLTVAVAGRSLEFSIDANTRKWTPGDTSANAVEEGEFPLIGYAEGKRYELYSDGSFAEVEL
jgi:hypothetical protein